MRKLKDRDLEILKRLAPEVEDRIRSGRGVEYRSILPPVSMHFAVDEEDLEDRLRKLPLEDLTYLADRILDGSECLSCVSEEHARVISGVVKERISSEAAGMIKERYRESTGFEI